MRGGQSQQHTAAPSVRAGLLAPPTRALHLFACGCDDIKIKTILSLSR